MLLGRALTIGGAERQFAQLAAGLAGRGHAVTLATFYQGDAFAANLAETGVRFVSLGKRGRWDVLPFLRRLRAEVAHLAPDVVYSFLTPANLLTAALRFLPHRLVWGFRASDLELRHYDPVFRLATGLERRLAGTADLVITNSEAARRDALARGLAARRLEVVPNGIDVAAFRPFAPAARRAARAALGLDGGGPVIGMVARLDPMKDHETFLHALSRLPDRGVRAVIAGAPAGPERARLEAIAAGLGLDGRVRWLGPVDDVRDVYAALDVLCLSSAFGEGFPNVLGEAMACGLPCVATDVGDCRAILDGLGTVTPPRDPDSLADALLAACTRARREPGLPERLRARVLERYSLAHMVGRTEDLLLRLRDRP
jgi:glycosyltransferase involved in cell wall biosynthesis